MSHLTGLVSISGSVLNKSTYLIVILDFPSSSDGKASVYHAGDLGSIPGFGISPGEGNSNPLQYSGLGNPMDRGAWLATLSGAVKSWTQLSNFHFHFSLLYVRTQKTLLKKAASKNSLFFHFFPSVNGPSITLPLEPYLMSLTQPLTFA